MDFFYGISKNRTLEPKVGAIGIELSGQDWLGLGAIFGGMSTGTSLCGSKPTCISLGSGSSCKQKQDAYNECVKNSLTLYQDQLSLQEKQFEQESQNIALFEKREKLNRIFKISIIITVSVGVLIATVLIIKKYRKSKTLKLKES